MSKLFWVLLSIFYFNSALSVEIETIEYAVKDGVSLKMDRYFDPELSEKENQPTLIYMFGGGFTSGARSGAEVDVEFFKFMASSGCQVFTIDYRLGLKGKLNSLVSSQDVDMRQFIELLSYTVDIAVEDLYSATNFLLENSEQYSVDSERIFACGSSAGAIAVTTGEYNIVTSGDIASSLPSDFNYAGVISFAGAVFAKDEDVVLAKDVAPLLLYHGTEDKDVPYGVMRLGGMVVYGSREIASMLLDTNAKVVFNYGDGVGHSLSYTPMEDHCDTIINFVNDISAGLPPDNQLTSISGVPPGEIYGADVYFLSRF